MSAPFNSSGFDIVIVGAGLSGLVSLLNLIDSPSASRIKNVHVIEARGKVGGRLQSCSNAPIDLGASWTWSSDAALRRQLRDLSINTFDQPWEGKVVTVTGSGSMKRDARFGESPCGAGGQRIVGGAASIPVRLVEYINELRASNKIKWHFDTAVTAIGSGGEDEDDVVEVELNSGVTLVALAVILAVPPAAAAKIEFLPPLPPQRMLLLGTTKTWMSDILKFALIYEERFWVKDGLSGFGILENSSIVETTWDASDGKVYSISGFARPTAASNRGDVESIKRLIISDVTKCFGEKAATPSDVHFIDWSFSNFNVDLLEDQASGNTQHLQYGHKHLRTPFNRRVIFSGTESEECNGHMEGAVRSGVRAANEAFTAAMGRRRKSVYK